VSSTVLVCDDAVFMRTMVSDILSQAGFTVVGEAENGKQAVEKYQQLKRPAGRNAPPSPPRCRLAGGRTLPANAQALCDHRQRHRRDDLRRAAQEWGPIVLGDDARPLEPRAPKMPRMS